MSQLCKHSHCLWTSLGSTVLKSTGISRLPSMSMPSLIIRSYMWGSHFSSANKRCRMVWYESVQTGLPRGVHLRGVISGAMELAPAMGCLSKPSSKSTSSLAGLGPHFSAELSTHLLRSTFVQSAVLISLTALGGIPSAS